MFDSVYVFAKGLATMDSGHSIKPVNLSCDVEKPWDDGLTLYNYLDAVVSTTWLIKSHIWIYSVTPTNIMEHTKTSFKGGFSLNIVAVKSARFNG